MEKKLIFDVMLPLKEISLRRVTVILWSQTDMLTSVDIGIARDKITDNLPKLGLPPLLTKQIEYLVQPIGWEIKNWKLFHVKYLYISLMSFDIRILEQLCWTTLGTIDYRKTAENLIRLEILDIVRRYKLACRYCLEYSITVLWRKLPDKRKEYFYKEVCFDNASQSCLEFCWPYILKGEETKLDALIARQSGFPGTFNQYAFKYSASKGNKEATEYFFKKFTFDEREDFLLSTANEVLSVQEKPWYDLKNFSRERQCDTFRYLLSSMSPEQQVEIFKRHPFKILLYALNWPWQHTFWNVAAFSWPFLTKADYVNMLNRITKVIVFWVCPTNLFREFFLQGSSDFRKHFVDKEFMEYHHRYYFSAIFHWMDSETIKTIFKAVDSSDRKRLASSRRIFNFFYESLSRGKYHFVEQCLQEAVISKEDKEELKESYFGFLTETDTNNVKRREEMWKHFLHFLE